MKYTFRLFIVIVLGLLTLTMQHKQTWAAKPDIPDVISASAAASAQFSLVGWLQIKPTDQNAHGDVSVYKKLAMIGSTCRGDGITLIDISAPATPKKLAQFNDVPDTALEKPQVIRINGRDVMTIGLRACAIDAGTNGIELVDISKPSQPKRISVFETAGSVSEFDILQTPNGRILALLAIPGQEAELADAAGLNGRTNGSGMLILDISNPAKPVVLRRWSILDEPKLGNDVFRDAQQGVYPATYLNSVRANDTGTRAYLSYWDAGTVILDIRNPLQPVFLGRTEFNPSDEGNAATAVDGSKGSVLIEATQDYDPFRLVFTSDAFTGTPQVLPLSYSRSILNLPGRKISGEIVAIGKGCTTDSYLDDPGDKIALIERGGCSFGDKVALAQQAGATAAIIFDSQDIDGEVPSVIPARNTIELPDGTQVEITIPGFYIGGSSGQRLLNGSSPVSVQVTGKFKGWGGLQIYDIKNPAKPVRVSEFATDSTNDIGVVDEGTFSARSSEIVGTTAFVSWFSDGLRAVDISDPAAPREIASWTGQDSPRNAPPVFIWGVAVQNDLIFVSDMGYGLYILKLVK